MTLWHGVRLAYRPLGPVFNRLLHGAEYLVLNLPGVLGPLGLWGFALLSLCDDSSLARSLGFVYA